MATIKSFTDLSQSKVLAEILPHESVDMCYSDIFVNGEHQYNYHCLGIPGFKTFEDAKTRESARLKFIPCWSLAALIGILPLNLKDNIGTEFHLSMDKEYIEYSNPNLSSLYSTYIHTCGNDNLVDACYEMILKLHELKML